MKALILVVLALGFSSCTTPNWQPNAEAAHMFRDFVKHDEAPFTGAAPMRPIIYQSYQTH